MVAGPGGQRPDGGVNLYEEGDPWTLEMGAKEEKRADYKERAYDGGKGSGS